MKKDKMPYVHNHITVMEERMQQAQQLLKWISSDIKFIKKISASKEEVKNNLV